MPLKGEEQRGEWAINGHIAKLIIILHEDGYIYDFLLFGDLQLHCIQLASIHRFEEVNINRIGLSGHTPKKLLIAIETTCGLKGILHTVLCIPCFDLLKKEELLSGKNLVNGSRLKMLINE